MQFCASRAASGVCSLKARPFHINPFHSRVSFQHCPFRPWSILKTHLVQQVRGVSSSRSCPRRFTQTSNPDSVTGLRVFCCLHRQRSIPRRRGRSLKIDAMCDGAGTNEGRQAFLPAHIRNDLCVVHQSLCAFVRPCGCRAQRCAW
jgi:hypothetical protein